MIDDKAQDKERQLDELKKSVSVCTKCKLHKTRTQTVFGEGSHDARIMFIGEGPGRDEDAQGRPFVGRAGQLLTSIIEKGMKIPRKNVFIANIVKCRPTIEQKGERDRPPDDEETLSCGDYLRKQIDIIRPRVIITLGNPSTKFLLSAKLGITKIRGTWGMYRGIRVMPTYHPSYILRNGGDSSPLKRDVWNDIRKVIKFLEGGETETDASGEKKQENIQPQDREDTQGKLF